MSSEGQPSPVYQARSLRQREALPYNYATTQHPSADGSGAAVAQLRSCLVAGERGGSGTADGVAV